jgi:asparagine synthase (glutamine-hydrolysing)
MFAFVVVDHRARRAYMVRDAFGIKPLFYRAEGACVAFASEIAPLAARAPEPPLIDLHRALDFLVAGRYDGGEGTLLDGVRQVAAGCLVEVDLLSGRQSGQRRWWRPQIDADSYSGREEAVERIRWLLLDSVRLHLRSDVPWGVALSGGVDSSAIACAVRHVAPDASITAVTYSAPGYERDETSWARMVADAIGAEIALAHLDVAADSGAELDDVIRAQGEPFGSPSIVAQYRVFRAARELGLTVMLEGQGADEVFCGYQGYPGHRVLSLLDDRRPLDAIRFIRAWRTWPDRSLGEVVRESGVALLDGGGPAAVYRRFGPAVPTWIRQQWLEPQLVDAAQRPLPRVGRPPRGRRVAGVAQATLQLDGLTRLLRHGDRSAMRWSIENRVPFLTTDLVECLLRMPEDYVVSPTGETKSLLRDAMEGIVPEPVLRRRDKVGFETPEGEWLRGNEGLFRSWLADAPADGIIDPAALARALGDGGSGRSAASHGVWRALNFLRWQTLIGAR